MMNVIEQDRFDWTDPQAGGGRVANLRAFGRSLAAHPPGKIVVTKCDAGHLVSVGAGQGGGT